MARKDTLQVGDIISTSMFLIEKRRKNTKMCFLKRFPLSYFVVVSRNLKETSAEYNKFKGTYELKQIFCDKESAINQKGVKLYLDSTAIQEMHTAIVPYSYICSIYEVVKSKLRIKAIEFPNRISADRLLKNWEKEKFKFIKFMSPKKEGHIILKIDKIIRSSNGHVKALMSDYNYDKPEEICFSKNL